MSATCAVRPDSWVSPSRRGLPALAVLLLSCVVLVCAGEPAKRLLSGHLPGLSMQSVGLQAAVSAAAGARDSQFAVRDRDGHLFADGGGLSSVFGRLGPQVHSGPRQVDLQFAGIGYRTLTRPAPVVPQASRNVVSYRRSGVSEWYRSGPLGLEQGFTVSRRPSAVTGAGWLTVAVDATGSLRPAKQGSEIVFGDALRYGGVSAIDAAGRSLPVRLDLRGRTLLLRVDDRNARYPLTIDPLIQQGPELTPSDEVGNASFGWSVALSADGDTALVGAPEGGHGAAWIFTRSGSTWTQQCPALSRDTGTLFGSSVALSADGNTALVGDINDLSPTSGLDGGAVWVFTRTGSAWSQRGSALSPTDGVGLGHFGSSISLSSDGNTALIGGGADNSFVGAAWVFLRAGSTWTQEGTKLLATDETGAGAFGYSTALSADGNTALIGGPDDNSQAGATWVFTQSASTWTQQGQKLTASDETGAGNFGWSVALSGDGNTALVGGLFDDSNAGAAWSFTRSGTSWAQDGPKITNDAGLEAFGVFTTLSSDGNTALIGGLNPGPSWAIAILYARSGTSWIPVGQTADGVPADGLGVGATLSGDGSTVLVGGDLANSDAGEVSVFAVTTAAPDAPTDVVATAGDGEATVSFTPPASNGGAPVLAYTVTASPGGATASDVDSPITVTGLTDGTAYTFTVTATNSAGTGAASAPSSPATPVSAADGGGGGGGGSGGGSAGTPDLALAIGAPRQVAAGSQATFTATVSDPDGTLAFDTQVLFTLPAGATVDTASSDRGLSCAAGANAGTLDCPLNFLGTLDPADSILVAHVTIVLTLPTAGAATLSATVSDVEGDRNNANNTASATVQVTAPPPTTTTAPPKPKPVAKKAAATVAIVGVQPVQLGKRPKLRVTLRVSKTATIVLTLLGPKGKIVARWSVHLKPGIKHLALALPAKARHKGRDTLRVRIGSSKPKTTHVLLRA